MRHQQPARPTPPPAMPDRHRAAGLYGEVAALPVNRIAPPPAGESRAFL